MEMLPFVVAFYLICIICVAFGEVFVILYGVVTGKAFRKQYWRNLYQRYKDMWALMVPSEYSIAVPRAECDEDRL